jgi:polyhydroxyalkanoate synthesis repressor PhaR
MLAKEHAVSDDKPGAGGPVTIKKYANRRLYNTATSAYVTLEDLAAMVKQGVDFVVYDAKTGEEITRSVLTQIIFALEEKSEGQNLLPIRFLRQLIRFYGDSMQALVPSYLELSIESLTREQEKFRTQLAEAFGDPFEAIADQAQRNMALFERTLAMFNPFARAASAASQPSETEPEKPAPKTATASPDDLGVLREQLAAMQKQIDELARKRKD